MYYLLHPVVVEASCGLDGCRMETCPTSDKGSADVTVGGYPISEWVEVSPRALEPTGLALIAPSSPSVLRLAILLVGCSVGSQATPKICFPHGDRGGRLIASSGWNASIARWAHTLSLPPLAEDIIDDLLPSPDH